MATLRRSTHPLGARPMGRVMAESSYREWHAQQTATQERHHLISQLLLVSLLSYIQLIWACRNCDTLQQPWLLQASL